MSLPDLETQAEALPLSAGVYLFKDPRGEVLYVGKAINLKSRVKQYLQGHDSRAMVRFLVAEAAAIDVVPVRSEREALLMESTLIKQHRPRYNVKWRDDKNFLHMRLDTRGAWPRFTLVRQLRNDGARYFGPYHTATHARRTLQFIGRNFPLRTCTDAVLRSRSRPCILHQMGRCLAPCVERCTPPAYQAVLDDALLFLSGKNRELVERVRERMEKSAEEEHFEDAARWRDLGRLLNSAMDRQAVVDIKLGERDVWAVHREGDRGVVVVVPVRDGMAQEPIATPFSGEPGEIWELLSSSLNAWYEGGHIPRDILVPVELPDRVALQEVLAERRGGPVRLSVPRRGERARVLEIANGTAKARFLTTHPEDERFARTLWSLAELLGLPIAPHRIECFDNSNLMGGDPVAAMVVFLDGRPARAEYRRYKVKTVVGADDYATMREILGRRLRRGVEEGELPDLIVVDGGAGQLNAARDVLRELGLLDQPVIGLSKPRTEHARGELDASDKIVLPDQAEPVRLRPDDPILRMLQHLRDQAHETAIGFHRKQRSKSSLHSALDDVPGVGPARRKALLRHFGSMSALKAASVDQVASLDGFGPLLAEKIVLALAPAAGESRTGVTPDVRGA